MKKIDKRFRHGFTPRGAKNNKFYFTFSRIKSRCNNSKTSDYPRYGGRGIKCLWKSFEEFRDDMYESYQAHVKEFGEKDTSIDRRDNNGNYELSNCRWATDSEQRRNKRTNHFVEYKGKTYTVVDLAKILNLKYSCLYARIIRNQPLEKI